MTSASRIVTVARMLARELLRRRVAVILLLLLPLSFYLVQLSEDIDALVAGGIGIAWAIGATGLFSSLASRPVDPRLVLAGYRPAELFLGRLLFLEALALSLVALFSVVMVVLSTPERPSVVVLSIALTSVIAVPLGLLIGALLPRELEGTMVLIGIVGVQMAIQPPTPFLPLFGPLRLMEIAAGSGSAVLPPLLHGAAVFGAFFLAAVALWRWRMPKPYRHAGVRRTQ